jgi:hypothetical protein
MTPKLKRPPQSELINGVEQGPNGIPIEKEGWRVKDEGNTSERRERVRCGYSRDFAPVRSHSRSEQMAARVVGAYVIWRRPRLAHVRSYRKHEVG